MNWCCRVLLRNHSVNIHSLLIKDFKNAVREGGCRRQPEPRARLPVSIDVAESPELFSGGTLDLQCVQLLLSPSCQETSTSQTSRSCLLNPSGISSRTVEKSQAKQHS